jgi:DNA transformation protein
MKPAKTGTEVRQSLSDLPNIGEEMARSLESAGIRSPGDLRRVGSIEAAVRVGPYWPGGSVCSSALSALEGAIRGIRWHLIPKSERARLWQEYRRRVSGGA